MLIWPLSRSLGEISGKSMNVCDKETGKINSERFRPRLICIRIKIYSQKTVFGITYYSAVYILREIGDDQWNDSKIGAHAKQIHGRVRWRWSLRRACASTWGCRRGEGSSQVIHTRGEGERRRLLVLAAVSAREGSDRAMTVVLGRRGCSFSVRCCCLRPLIFHWSPPSRQVCESVCECCL
jgi:hypothetical protein